MSYPNGAIPLEKLVHLGGEHYLPPGTAARWQWLVAQAREKYGVTLRITQGPNGYRWLDAQWKTFREEPAGNAAYPGTSSHGGIWDDRVCMAIDVANWQDLGGKAAWGRFAALCRLAGFTVLLFDWEPWHITDFNDPWAVPDWAAGKTPLTPESEEDDDMAKNSGIFWKNSTGKHLNAIVNAGSGYFQAFESNEGGYNSGLARAFDTGSFESVSESHAQAIERACAAVRANKS